MSQTKEIPLMEKIVSLCKRRGFIFQSSEIYGGINGFWDYGPLGIELKNGDVAARANFCTLDAKGIVTDRRAGRIDVQAASFDIGDPAYNAEVAKPALKIKAQVSADAVRLGDLFENIGAELPAHSTKAMRVTIGYFDSDSSVNSSGCFTMP